MRLAGQIFDDSESQRAYKQLQDKSTGGSINPNDLMMTPEMTPSREFSSPFEQEFLRDKYILNNPGSGVARLPGGEQGPAQGYYTPIKNYGGTYMPDGTDKVPAPPMTPMGLPVV